MGLEAGVAVEQQGFKGQKEQRLFRVAVEDGFVLMTLRGDDRRKKWWATRESGFWGVTLG